MKMRFFLSSLLFLITSVTLSSCISNTKDQELRYGNLELIGEPYNKTLSPVIQIVNNCGLGGDVLKCTPQRTIISNDSIRWELNGQVGVGGKIGEGPVPAGIDLEGLIGFTVAHDWGQGMSLGNGWELTAKENEAVQYSIQYNEIWQKAKVDISNIHGVSLGTVNIEYRVGFETYIVEKQLLNCDDLSTNTNTSSITQPSVVNTVTSDVNTSINHDCWQTIWEYTPSDENDITEVFRQPHSSYYQYTYHYEQINDTLGSLEVYTNMSVDNLLEDPNSFSWIINSESIFAEDADYRVIAWMKTDNAMESHISIVAQNQFLQDIYVNGTNQMAKVPPHPGNGSYDWKELRSLEFNPKEWSQDSEIIIIGINAGPSFEGGLATTWFGEILLQKCVP